MSEPRPELLFVGGPQEGERSVIMGDEAVAGRLPSNDIHVQDATVSRRQMRLTRSAEGWVVENLSANGTWINGKRYRRKKQILLDTGDVLRVGRDTVLLFVAPEDDPEEALRAYREMYPRPEPPEPQGEPESPPEEARAEPEATEEPRESEGPPATARVDAEAQARQARKKKYLILFGAYAGLMLVVIVLLTSLSSEDSEDASGAPPRLSRDEIEQSLVESIDKLPNAEKADRMLEQALVHYKAKNEEPGNLFKAVKYFKLHLAYKTGGGFAKTDHYRMFQNAKDQLVERAVELYHQAYFKEQGRRWREAERDFRRLLEMIPARSDPEPAQQHRLFDSVLKHLAYVRKRQQQRQGR